MEEIYYLNEKPVYHWTYRWTDDYHYNKGYDNIKGEFTGTEEDFQNYVKAEQDGQGFTYGSLEKRPATKEEYEEMLYWL